MRFFWQEGISRSALFDGKKSRSRFVEQLLWEEEQRRGELLVPGQGPLGMAVAWCAAPLPRPKACPAQRPCTRPCWPCSKNRFRPQGWMFTSSAHCALPGNTSAGCNRRRKSTKGTTPQPWAPAIHDTLHALYEPYLNKEVRRGDISRETMLARFHEELEKADLRRILPPDSCLMLEEAAPVRLQRFLDNQPDSTIIVALEEELKATLSLAGGEYSFTGIMDRIDRRDDLLHILDYKTGSLKLHDGSLWGDILYFRRIESLFAALRQTQTGGGYEPDAQMLEDMDALFEELRPRLSSLQLPCYVSMAVGSGLGPVGDAALVELRNAGREYPLLEGWWMKTWRRPLDTATRRFLLYCCTCAMRRPLRRARTAIATGAPMRHYAQDNGPEYIY